MIEFSKLLGNRILIKQTRTKQVGKIIIAVDDQAKKPEAEVLQVGPDVTNVKVGDKVMLEKFAENTLEENDDGIFSIVIEDDIVGVLK